MQLRTRRSLITIAALALALTVSLSGCTGSGGNPLANLGAGATATKAPAKSPIAGKAGRGAPAVGSCWHGAEPQGPASLSWYLADDSHPVDCSKPHQLVTAAVVRLPSSTPNVESEQDQINEYVYEPADQACSDYIQKNMGGPDDQNGRFQFKVWFPPTADWKAGARWVRCDLLVYKLGSLVTAPKLENLPSFSTLKDQIKSNSSQFDLCVDVPGGTVADGPRAAGAVFTTCDGNAQWTFFQSFDLEDSTSSYPTPTVFKAQFDAQCLNFGYASGLKVVPWYPTAKDWADGTHGFECWGTSQ